MHVVQGVEILRKVYFLFDCLKFSVNSCTISRKTKASISRNPNLWDLDFNELITSYAHRHYNILGFILLIVKILILTVEVG